MVQHSRCNPWGIKNKIIVIGSGIGGLSTALRLQHLGFDVEIFEKEATPGGKTNILHKDGFTFDLSATIFMLPTPYYDLFTFIEEDINKFLNIKQLNPLYTLFQKNGDNHIFHSNLPELIKTIKSFNSDDVSGFLSMLSDVYNSYTNLNSSFLLNDLISTNDILTIKNLKNLYSSKPTKNCYNFFKKYITDENIINYLMFQSMYVGASPYTSNSVYSLIPCMSLLQGLYHIEGGFYKLITTLTELFENRGGKINYNSPVKKILFEKNNAKGVLLEDGRKIPSSTVICNSDFSYTLENLIPKNLLPLKYKKVCKLSYSPSTFIIYIGLNKKLPLLSTHNLFFADDFKASLEEPFNGIISSTPNIYVYKPSAIDESCIPKKDFETLNIMVRVPNLKDSSVDWSDKSFIRSYRDTILKMLENYAPFKDIENHIITEEYLTPLTYKNRFNSYAGSAFGLSHITSQSLFKRPQCKIKNINNLYFVGASIHPGNGVSMVLNSSKIVSEVIFKDYLNNKNKD